MMKPFKRVSLKQKFILFSSFYFLIIISTFLTSFYIGDLYENSQIRNNAEVQSKLNDVLDNSANISHDLVELEQEYNFDVIVEDSTQLVYTSTGSDIATQQIYLQEGIYSYETLYEHDNYEVFLLIYSISPSGFFKMYQYSTFVLMLILFVTTYFFISLVLLQILKPVKRLSENISYLKTYNFAELSNAEHVDLLNNELLIFADGLQGVFNKLEGENTLLEKNLIQQDINLKMQKSFLTSVVHDMKTPLSIINFSAQLVKQNGNITEEDDKLLDSILTKSNNISEIAKYTVNTVSSNDINVLKIKEYIDINKIITEILTDFSLLIDKSNLETFVDFEVFTVNYNKLELIQIFNNIISNAITYSIDFTVISFSVEGNCLYVTNHVDDVNYDYSKIFELNSTSGAGNGFGMYRIKKILESNGDNISFEIVDDVAITTICFNGKLDE